MERIGRAAGLCSSTSACLYYWHSEAARAA